MINRNFRWGLLVAVAVGLTYTGTSVGLKSGDWADWVSAVGTVGTLIGTIYLATSQSRQKSKDELTLARLHAASMVLRLTHAESMISSVCGTLFTSIETPIELGREHLIDMNSKLASIRPWGMSDLVPVVMLPKNTAVKLADAASHLDSVGILLSKTIADYPKMNSEQRLNFAKFMYAMLRSALEYIQESANVCSAEAGALHRQVH